MTRINCIDAYHLTNKHLLAEYRELPRIFKSILDNLVQDKDVKRIEEDDYRLGEGHMTFFNNKLNFLVKRYDRIIAILKVRKFNLSDSYNSYVKKMIKELEEDRRTHNLFKDWKPSLRDEAININRLIERSPEVGDKIYYENIFKEMLILNS